MKRLNLAIIVVFLSSCFLTTYTTYTAAQEEMTVDTEQAVYSGPTQFMVRDPDLGPNVYNQYNITGPLPPWWRPPSDWEILAAGVATGVIIAAIFPAFYDYGVGGIYFREASFIHHRFHNRRDHFRDFNRRIGPRFNSHFHSIARGRHFDPKSVRGPGGHGPGSVRKPGKAGPPPKAGMATRKAGPPPKAGMATRKAGPPGRMALPPRSIAPRAAQPRSAPPRMATPRPAAPRPAPSRPAPHSKAPAKKPNQK